jgi:26S proteasome regulatory subunit N1
MMAEMQFNSFARRMAPIALALTSVSAPLPELVDNLHRIGRDTDQAVAKNAGLALGLLAAGTMNTRALTVLKTLAGFHKDTEAVVVMMHIAEGLVSLGQGTLTLSPTYGDSLILNPVALGALLVLAHAAIYADTLLVSDSGDPLLFYFIAPAIAPRFLVTIDEELNIVRIPVRVGTALDVVGQAGSPRQVAGFQQLDTPVLIAAGQRAEIVDDTWEPLSPILEGFVIIRKKVVEAKSD